MSLSDEDLALILEGKAQKLKDGNKSRVEVNRELAQLVAEDVRALYGEDYVNDGRLQSQGRASFGRSNEALKGIAIFVPEGVDDQ